MFHLLTRQFGSRSCTTALAVAALLAVLSLQVVEFGHQHEQGDVSEQCLVCKADGGSALATAHEPVSSIAIAVATRHSRFHGPFTTIYTTHPARAPPLHS